MKASRLLPTALVLALLSAATFVALRRPHAHLATKQWAAQLRTADDDCAAVVLRRAAASGRSGIALLVEALGSDRRSVARAAKAVLLAQLRRWEALEARVFSENLAALADALAEQVEQLNPAAQSDAAELATRILLAPLDAGAVDRARVIGSCEKVLRIATGPHDVVFGQHPAGGRPSPPDQIGDGQFTTIRGGLLEEDLLLSGTSISESAQLPGGGLPADPFSPIEHAKEPEAEIPRSADIRLVPPRRLADLPDARPVAAPGESGPPATALHGDSPPGEPSTEHPRQPSGPPPVQTLSLNQPVNLGKLDLKELVTRLGGDEFSSRDAAGELMRRGLSARQIALARRLLDPDPQVRKQFARSLPGEPGIDAAAWLMWLCRDPDAEVRLTAITLLATTGDPALIEQVLQLARHDSDPRIRQRAEQIDPARQH